MGERWRRWAQRSAAVAGGGLAAVVLLDGSPVGRLGRAVVVAVGTVALRRVLRRVGGRTAAATAVAASPVPLAVGLGIAGPHLVKVGPSGLAVAASLAAAGGLGLLALGSIGSVRRMRWSLRVPTLLGLALVVLFVVPNLAVAVAATNVPPTQVAAPGAVGDRLGLREVRFRSDDGVVLAAWFAPGTNGAGVVVRHGAGSTRSSLLRHAEVLARHGYALLLVDARGHGDSGGRAMDLGWWGERDLAAAVSYLGRQPGVDDRRLAVVGLSMGGEEALGAFGADDRIAAVVAEGATGRAAPDKAWLSEVYGWRGWVQEQVERVQTAVVDLLTDAHPPRSLRSSVAAAAPRPALLVAAGEVPDEARAARWVRSGSPRSVQVWVVPGAGHTQGLAAAPREWERRVVGFLDAALAR